MRRAIELQRLHVERGVDVVDRHGRSQVEILLEFGLERRPEARPRVVGGSRRARSAGRQYKQRRQQSCSKHQGNQAPLPVGSGQVRYEIQYSNDGIATASNVTFRATAAGALQLDSPATVNIGDVAPGISGTVSFAGNINGGASSAELNVTVADELHGDFDWLWMQAPVDSAGPAQPEN